MECAKNDWVTDQRSKACYEREIAELKNQRDTLLEACEAWEQAIKHGEIMTKDLGTEMLTGEAIEKTKAALAMAKKEQEIKARTIKDLQRKPPSLIFIPCNGCGVFPVAIKGTICGGCCEAKALGEAMKAAAKKLEK